MDCYNILDYKSEHNYRNNKSGGGVSVFIKNSVEYICRNDLNTLNDCIESLFIELPKNGINNKNTVIGIIYRPPNSDIDVLNEAMCNILETLKFENKLTYIMGDFNINLFNYDSHTKTADFINLMFSYSYAPFINKPTRITEHSSTLIDNIFVNNYNDNTFQGLLFTDISDHFPVFIINKKIRC